MHFVLAMFSTSLFLATQSATALSLVFHVSLSSLRLDPALYIVESSAYITTLDLFDINGRKLVNIENKRGPRELP